MKKTARIVLGIIVIVLVLHAADLATRDCRIAPYVYDNCLWLWLRARLGLPASRFLRMAVLECVGIALGLVLYLTFRYLFPWRKMAPEPETRDPGPGAQDPGHGTRVSGSGVSDLGGVGTQDPRSRIPDPASRVPTREPRVVLTALEVVLIFAGILFYIWRWQYTAPHMWMPLWAVILASHVLHHDTLRGLGLIRTELHASARLVLPIALLCYLPLLLYGFAGHRLALLRPTWQSLVPMLGYAIWCVFQQYLAQSYFHNRLMLIIRNRHATSALIGVMFCATHIPNPVLMVATLVAGWVFAEVFARHRNIWPLALAQAVGGFLLAAVSPDTFIHHMRVGPGYFFYGIR
jgi:hypothetical protein